MTEPLIDEEKFVVPELAETMSSLPMQEQNTVRFANEYRENVKKYCVTDGDVAFQWNKIKKQTVNPVTVTINENSNI